MSPTIAATIPTPDSPGRSPSAALRTSVAALGLAVHAAALTRVHSLTAGNVPPAGALAAAGLLLGLGLALHRRPPAEALDGERRLAGLVGAGLSVVAVLGGPIVLSRASALGAGIVTTLLALLVGWLIGRADLVDLARPRLGLIALGLGLAGLSLPLVGPLPTALLAGGLLAVAALLPPLPAALDASRRDSLATQAPDAWTRTAQVILGIGCSVALLCLAALIRDQLASPWPLGFLLAAGLIAGLALGRVAAARPASLVVASLLGLGGLGLALHGGLARLAGSIAATLGLNLLEPIGGSIALIGIALVVALPAALVPGLILTGALDARRLIGAALGFAGAALLASWLRDPIATIFIAAALLGVASLRLLSVLPGRLTRIAVIAALALSLMLVTARWWRVAPDAGREDQPRTLDIDGQSVATTDPELAPSGRLAGHLAGLLAEEPRHVLVVGWPLPGLLEALSSHGPESILVAEPVPGAWASLAGLPEAPGRSVANVRWMGAPSPAALPADSRFDAIVVALPDPTMRHGESFFTPSGRAKLASHLSSDGAFVDIIDLGRTTPPDLFARLALLRESLPDPALFMADGGQSGLLLVVAPSPSPSPSILPSSEAASPEASAAAPRSDAVAPVERADAQRAPTPAETADDAATLSTPIRIRDAKLVNPPIASRDGRPFRLDRLLAPERLTPEVQASLRAGLILTPAQLMATLVAGDAEVTALGEAATARDPWTPGLRALTFAPPAELARSLGQALFHGRLQVVDLPVLPAVFQGRGDEGRSVPFIGIQTRLGVEWAVTGRLRYQNRLASFLGTLGVYRDRSRRVTFTRPGEEFTVTERPRHTVDLSVLEDSIGGLATGVAYRRGTGVVSGHPALWSFEQPSNDEQILVATWHCPVSERLFGLRYRLTEGVKPGLFEAVVEKALGSARCSHGAAARGDASWHLSAAPQASSLPEAAGGAAPDDSAVPPVPAG